MTTEIIESDFSNPPLLQPVIDYWLVIKTPLSLLLITDLAAKK